MRRTTRSPVASILFVLACDHGAAEPVTLPPPADAEPPIVAGQDPTPIAAPPASLRKGKSHAKVPADAPSFITVASRPDTGSAGDIRLFAIDGIGFAAAGSALLRLHPDGTIEHERAWARGIDDSTVELDGVVAGMNWWQAESLGGAWPEGTILALRPQSGSRGGDETPEVYRRTNAMWTRIATQERLFAWYPRSLGAWKDGSLLALKAFEPRYAHPGDESEGPPEREVVAAAKAIAKQKRLVVLRGTPKAPAFGARPVQAFASQASGEIIAAIGVGDAVVMLHHDESGAADRELALPAPGALATEGIELRMRAPDDAWLLAHPPYPEDGTPETPGLGAYLAHFDGKVWSRVDTECAYQAHGLSVDGEGSAYFTCQLRIDANTQPYAMFRVRRGVLEELPFAGDPAEVLALAPDDIWVVQYPSGPGPAVLLHSGGEPRTQTIPSTIQAAHEVLEWTDPHPIGEGCRSVWLPLLAGADRAAIATAVDAMSDGIYAQVVDARVRGEAVPGVIVRVFGDHATRRIAKLRKALGPGVGPASCNEYPPVVGDSHE